MPFLGFPPKVLLPYSSPAARGAFFVGRRAIDAEDGVLDAVMRTTASRVLNHTFGGYYEGSYPPTLLGTWLSVPSPRSFMIPHMESRLRVRPTKSRCRDPQSSARVTSSSRPSLISSRCAVPPSLMLPSAPQMVQMAGVSAQMADTPRRKDISAV